MPNAFRIIEGAVAKMEEAIGDVTSLDVVTLTGSISIKNSLDDKNNIKLKRLWAAIQEQATAEADLTIVAFTHIDLDADSINFVDRNLTEEKKALLIAHNESVKAAQETRSGIVAMVKAFF
jgi:hypothetical protein